MEITGSIFVGAMLEPAKGMWFSLPVSGKDVVEKLKLMGAIGGNSGNEEYVIADYELPFKQMNTRSIDKLSESFKNLQNFDYDTDNFELLVDAQLVDPMDFTQDDVDEIEIFEATSLDELGQELVEIVGGVSELSSDNLETYFDYNYFASDRLTEGSIEEEDGKYIGDDGQIFNAMSLDELGLELVEIFGGISQLSSDNLESYFDYEYFARDHITEGSIVEENGTYIRDNR